jgi:hypothetical protein
MCRWRAATQQRVSGLRCAGSLARFVSWLVVPWTSAKRSFAYARELVTHRAGVANATCASSISPAPGAFSRCHFGLNATTCDAARRGRADARRCRGYSSRRRTCRESGHSGGQTGLVLGHELGIEGALAISRHVHADGPSSVFTVFAVDPLRTLWAAMRRPCASAIEASGEDEGPNYGRDRLGCGELLALPVGVVKLR